MTMTVQVLMKL